MSFGDTLIHWHQHSNQRQLPWKAERNIYKIWLSEIILQQTRAEQGKAYYLKFIKKYPDIYALAQADLDDVLSLWEGLGYYSRARNLHYTANTIVNEYKGVFPKTAEGLLKLKGVGPYTAAAIASFGYEEAVPVIDGNSLRLISRYHGIASPIDKKEGKNKILKFLQNEIKNQTPSQFNQALMDFGATVCKPKSPECSVCPFQPNCKAYRDDLVEELPIKANKTKKKNRYFHYFLNIQQGEISLQKRISGDIWQELYELPLIEKNRRGKISLEQVQNAFNNTTAQIKFLEQRKQILSHRIIHAYFYLYTGSILAKNKLQIAPIEEIHTFAFPRVIRCFFEENALFLNNNQ